ncbi:Probable RNA-directed DNA polymerase from transposon BS [Eumeta japonica]|uniref:Probable RNA-directed DNA polymerase from transposon BS n=1 Tax=Eumeta variegata TaxID=151549 RepID=A0A4C1YWF8_EUMVA|nr:Probable RNA-directed DNA polymerase from transposon BS [Eumeta japonica]
MYSFGTDRTPLGEHSSLSRSIYHPQKLLRSDIEALLALGDTVILFGDFNCKHTNWRCAVSNPGGNKLAKLSRKLKFNIVALFTPTHYPDDLISRPSTIDIAITKEIALNVGFIEPIYRFVSDHRSVLLRLGPSTGGCPKPMIKITDWKRVSTALEEVDTPALITIPDVIEMTNEIDSSIGALTNHIRTVVKECSREVPASVDGRKLPADALELLRAKNAALRLSYAYPSRENRSRARALQRRVRAPMIEVKNEEWSNLMEDISRTHKAFWKVTKALKSEGYLPTPPLKIPDSSLAVDDQEKAECIADSIELQCSHTLPSHDTQYISLIEEEVRQRTSLDPLDDLSPVSLDEVQKLVKGLKAKKAPGLDGISDKAIKCFPLTLLSLLVTIFNACLKNSYFPPVWKEAEVIGIPKPGKPRNLPASYRPISLLSGLGKMYEKILKTRLSEYLYGKGLIINEQFGFRQNHSCPQQALRLVEYITEGFKTKKRTVAVFLDVAKAFDRKNDKREYLKAPRSLPFCTPCTLTIYRVRRQASSSRCSQTIPPCNYAVRRNKTFALTSRRPSRSWLDCFKPGGSRTVLTYASPVFAHAAPKTLKKLQVLQNKFCRSATDTHWCVKNSVLHRDLDLPSIRKYMKDASERFRIAESHPIRYFLQQSLKAPPLSFHPSSPALRTTLGRDNKMGPTRAGVPVTAGAKGISKSPTGQVTRRQHLRVLPGRIRGFQSHTTHAYGHEGVKKKALKNMKRTNQSFLLGFFSKKERPKSHELMSKDDVDFHNFEEVNRVGPSTDINGDEVKKETALGIGVRFAMEPGVRPNLLTDGASLGTQVTLDEQC